MTDCGHDHSIGGHTQHRADGGRLLAALAVIFVFMIVEVAGGIVAGSLALLADAAHMMTDAFALALAASAHWMSMRPANTKLHFGYRRLQVLAAFVNGIALIFLMSWIVYEAIRRAITPIEVSWAPMLVVAALGLAANGVAFRLLHRAGEHNINIKGAMLHVASDLLGSIAAVIAAIVIWLTGWTRIDPILSVFVAALIARSALKLLRETTHILLEGAPKHIDADALARDLTQLFPDVEDVHSVKIWQLTPDQLRLTLHARLRDGACADDTLQVLKRRLEGKYGIRDSTIQIEGGRACPDHEQEGTEGRDHDSHEHGIGEPVKLRAAHGHAAHGARASGSVAAIHSLFK